MRRHLFLIFIFIATLAVAGCKISGTVTKEGGVGVGGVTVYLAGEGEDGVGSIMATTDGDGNFAFEGFHHGTLTITPESPEFDFTPESQTMTIGFFENVLDANFTASAVEETEPPRSSEKPEKPWSTYQGNAAHSGYVPVYLNSDEFEHSWTWPDETTQPIPINPVATGDGKVFVTTAWDSGVNVLMALDSAAGGDLWRYDFEDIDSINPPSYANGTVYVQSTNNMNDSFLWAFNGGSGNDSFKTVYDNQWDRYYAPTIYDGYVYTGGGQHGGVYEFFDTGLKSWFVKLTQSDQWTPAVDAEHVIAYNGWYRYGASENFPPQMTVIDRLNGVEEFHIPDLKFEYNEGSMNLAPVLGSQNNVIAIQGGRLISFDLAGKKIGWQIPGDEEVDEGDDEEKGGKHFSGQPSVANGFIYTVYKGYLHARNESDGAFVWEWQPPDGSIDYPMIVTDNLIFVGTESAANGSTTYAIDLESHTDVWDYPAVGHLALSNDGMLFIATPEGELIAISTIATE